jgi:1-acyl-sn-glycerol-3-phosphate acyltransferase
MGLLRAVLRGAPLALILIFGLSLLLLLRLIERPIFGMHRPVTPYITQAVCRSALVLLRLKLTARGPRMAGPGAIVANHTSWLDIFVLNSRKNVYFVSKAEVASWPGIGWLARATGTLFIRRDPREAKAQTQMFESRLLDGHRLLFFPEGTSTDGIRVLPFKTTLFAAFFSDRLRESLQVQGVSVIYHAPNGEEPRFYGWWGDMEFGPSLLKMLAQKRQGWVELIYHDPVRVADFSSRKSLAAHLEAQVRAAHQAARPGLILPEEEAIR